MTPHDREELMADKQKLLQDTDEAYAELRRAIDGLDEKEMRRVWLGTWGVREILIHISGWHREMIPAFARLGREEPPYPEGVSYDDADAWNSRFVEGKSKAPMADILRDLDTFHRDFVTAAAALSEHHFAPGAPARELFEGAGSLHYREHAGQIDEWRRNGAP